MALRVAIPTEWSLDILPTTHDVALERSQWLTYHRHQAYVDALCFYTFLPWFQADYDARARAWLPAAEQQALWGRVVGSAVLLGADQAIDRPARRLVLLPTETHDLAQIDIPQEWVDIPSWAADYFLMVYVEPEGTELTIYGYTTHRDVKTKGMHDPGDRTYVYNVSDLHLDLNAFWQIVQCCPDAITQGTIASLPVLNNAQIERLIEYLARPELAFALQTVPFEQYAALLSQSHERKRLAQQWLGALWPREEPILEQSKEQVDELAGSRWATSPCTYLRQWFQTVANDHWQSLESLGGAYACNPIAGVRKGVAFPVSQIRRAKLIDLVTDGGQQRVTLLIQLSQEPDARMGVLLQLYPEPGIAHLPADVSLTLRSQTEEILQSVQSSVSDDYLQLTRFRCRAETSFLIEISLEGAVVIESFIA